jgi:hypothetical protein
MTSGQNRVNEDIRRGKSDMIQRAAEASRKLRVDVRENSS